jgi:hypothetical protein
MKTKKGTVALAAICVLAIGMLLVVHADDKKNDNTVHFTANLNGFQELGALNNETGAILTEGKGTLQLTLDKAAQTISYELTYSGLSASVTQAHIHFGRVHVPGGVMVFFCSNLTSPPPGTQACPSGGGTITGTWSATNVQGIAGQNVTAGDFDALTDALFSNSAYANVHTTKFPAGEIRGQVHKGDSAGRGRGNKQ